MNAVQLDLLNERQFQRLANNEVHHSGMVGAPYQSGSATSKAAAEKIAPKVSRLEGYVLDALYHSLIAKIHEGMTDEELDVWAISQGAKISTLRPRRIGLAQWVYRVLGKVERAGGPLIEGPKVQLIRPALVEQTQEKRKTRFGNLAYVHRLTEEGRKVAEERARQ